MIRLALFDIDGTLTDGRCPLMVAAFKVAIAEHMRISAVPEDIVHDGFTDLRTLTELGVFCGLDRVEAQARAQVTLAAKDRLLSVALKNHQADLAPITACEGAPFFVAMLRDAGVLLGLVTGNTALAAGNKLERAGFTVNDFPLGAYGDSSIERSDLVREAINMARKQLPDLESEQVWVIGDTPYDVQAAIGAGVHSLAVASGGFDTGDLRASGADLVVASLRPDASLRAALGLGPTQGL
jgi:phosphoglycolate phosphatase-like HAD superfamily hydrolase